MERKVVQRRKELLVRTVMKEERGATDNPSLPSGFFLFALCRSYSFGSSLSALNDSNTINRARIIRITEGTTRM